MSNADLVRLREDVCVDPLINGWYAWAFLLSPAAASFVQTRNVGRVEGLLQRVEQIKDLMVGSHLMATSLPEISGDEASQIHEALDRHSASTEAATALRNAILAVDGLLAKMNGGPLTPFYRDVPDILKGAVELVYDRYHRPGFFLHERVLYEDGWMNRQSQTMRLYGPQVKRRPAFLLPRFSQSDVFDIDLPFTHAGYDVLFRSRYQPTPFEHVCAALNVDQQRAAMLRPLFEETETASSEIPCDMVTPPAAKIFRYFGHASILASINGKTFLTDPWIPAFSTTAEDATYGLRDLPQHIDYVIISHAHADHLNVETLLELRHRVGHVYVPRGAGRSVNDPSMKVMIESLGFERVQEVDYFEDINLGDVTLTALPFFGEHGDLDVTAKASYLLSTRDFRCAFLSDSKNIVPELYDRLAARLHGGVDLVFVGMECEGAPVNWLYEPVLTSRVPQRLATSRRLAASDCSEASDLAARLDASQVAIYAMGYERSLAYLIGKTSTDDDWSHQEARRFIAQCNTSSRRATLMRGRMEMVFP
ncbi:MBL fold metallo-hydrolase [Paraburkholderia sp. SIMBA_027]|uniref:MBL fold metallo-hydrolase n=2 Tax=Pseudomonadati TaxID=3379134 RepID=UPI00397C3123